MKLVRIFISSPGDVAEERSRARQVVEGLRRRYVGRLTLAPVLWEDLPLPAHHSFQQGIDPFLSAGEGIDIAIFILWARLGTPLGPSVAAQEGTPSRSGTEREFSLMLEARRRSGGQRPDILVYTRQDESSFLERLRGEPIQAKKELLEQKELVERFLREEFQDAETKTNVRAYHSFDRPVTFAQRLRRHLEGLLDERAGGESTAPIWQPERDGPPFLALDAFAFQHAPIFFGREDEIVEGRRALGEAARRGCAWLLIAGASGSGKSSLARAGLLPAIAEYEVDETVCGWRHLAATPSALAEDPGGFFEGFARALGESHALPELGTAGSRETRSDLATGLARDAELVFRLRLKEALHEAAQATPPASRLVLLIDQLEELFSDQRIDPETRASFIKCLDALARSGSVWVVATVRSDFLPHCQQPGLLAGGADACPQLILLPPGVDALARLIAEPARLAGLRFEQVDGRRLDEVILAEASTHRELLPLLEFVLRELYERRAPDGLLTYASYEAVGGVLGAVAASAEEAITQLPAEAQASFESLMWQLVSVAEGEEESVIRRRMPLAELEANPHAKVLVMAFVHRRLLTISGTEEAGSGSVSVAHEVLLRVWQRAVDWVARNRRFLAQRATVEAALGRWLQEGRDRSLLLQAGLPLEEGRELLRQARHTLSVETAEYIELSQARVAEERRAARGRRRAAFATLSALLLLAVAGGALAWRQSARAEQESRRALAAKAEVDHQLVAVSRADDAAAARFIEEGHPDLAIASLGRALKNWPGNHAAAFRLWTTVTQAEAPLAVLPVSSRPLPKEHYAAAVSPDGRLLVTSEGTAKAVLRDLDTGQVLRTFEPKGSEPVRAVAFSRDGARLLTGCKMNFDTSAFGISPRTLVRDLDAEIKKRGIDLARFGPSITIWETNSGAPLLNFRVPQEVACAAFSPDGRLVATGSGSDAMLYEAGDGTVHSTLHGHADAVVAVAFSLDGRQVATGSQDGEVKLWDVASGQETLALNGHAGAVCSLDFSADGKILAAGYGEGFVKLWSLPDRKDFQTFARQPAYIRSVAFSADGTKLLTASADLAQLWDATTGAPLASLPAEAAFWLGNGSVLTLAEGAHRWNVQPGPEHVTLRGHESFVYHAIFSHDGRHLLSTSEDKTARWWDTKSGMEQLSFRGHENYLLRAALSQDEQLLLTGSRDQTARLWDVASGKELRQLPHAAGVWGVALSPDGSTGATVSGGICRLWETRAGRLLKELPAEGKIECVAFSPDGKSVFTGGAEAAGRLWDSATGHETGKFAGRGGGFYSAVFSGDGHRLLTSGQDGEVQIFDARSGAILHDLHGLGNGYILGGALSDEGRYAIAYTQKTAALWDLSKALLVWRFEKSGEDFIGAHFLSGMVCLATSSVLGNTVDLHVRRLPLELGPPPDYLPEAVTIACGLEFAEDGTLRRLSLPERLERRARLPSVPGASATGWPRLLQALGR